MPQSTQFERHTPHINHAGLIVAQCGIPACFESDPGQGKTMTLARLAMATDRKFISYELSRTQPEDLQGFPVVTETNIDGQSHKVMRFVPDLRLLQAEHIPSILLLDEVTNVSPAKQAPALNLIQSGLPNAWMFMACNAPEKAADGYQLSCPFINRIWYGLWQIDLEAQHWGLMNACDYPDPDVPIVPPGFMKYQPQWGSLAVGFLDRNPGLYNACPAKALDRHKPWPSSRSWNNMTVGLAGMTASMHPDLSDPATCVQVRDNLILGFIGTEAGTQFIDYLNKLGLPTAQDFLDNEAAIPTRYDLLFSITKGVVNHCAQHAEDQEVYAKALDFQRRLADVSDEMSQLFSAGIKVAMPKLSFVKPQRIS